MNAVLSRNSVFYMSICPYCLEDFDLADHLPHQRKNGCGHSLCAACVAHIKSEKLSCPVCWEKPSEEKEEVDGEFVVHQLMKNNLPLLKKVLLKNEGLRTICEDLLVENMKIKQENAMLTGKRAEGVQEFQVVSGCGGKRPSERDENFDGSQNEFKEGRWQYFELMDALENVMYDNEMMEEDIIPQVEMENERIRMESMKLRLEEDLGYGCYSQDEIDAMRRARDPDSDSDFDSGSDSDSDEE